MKQATQFARINSEILPRGQLDDGGEEESRDESSDMESICIVIGPLRIDVIA